MLRARIGRRAWLVRSAIGAGGLIRIGRRLFADPAAALGGNSPPLLPWPQFAQFDARKFPLVSGEHVHASIRVDESIGSHGSKAALIISEEIKRRTGQTVEVSDKESRNVFEIRLSPLRAMAGEPETTTAGGYRLEISSGHAMIEGRDVGLSYAAQTFNQLMEGWRTLQVRAAKIRDWPEFGWRGVYNDVPSVAGMTLADWKEFILYASALKLNAINVGLYGCWQRSPTVELDSEFFLFPSRNYPQFQTPVRSVRFDAQTGKPIIRRHLPEIYAEDFFGEVVRFGIEHDIEVSPCFESLGHNTLIPRVVPEISMKDADCKPIGYGFCTTCSKTYEVLFSLYDEIISRYQAPYGITTFNVGLDEVTAACQCPACREAWHGVDDFYVNHLIKIAKHLRNRGMKRVLVWHDILHRCGLINKALESRLAAEGLRDLITIAWWCYDKPFYEDSLNPDDSFCRGFFRPRSTIEYWGVPSAGWDTVEPLAASLRTQNEALVDLAERARERSATGILSYSIHDPMFDQGYRNFSQYSWNLVPSLRATHRRYSRWLSDQNDTALSGYLGLYERAYDSYRELVDFFYDRAAPIPMGRALASIPPAATREGSFSKAINLLETASQGLLTLREGIQDPAKRRIVQIYEIEVRRFKALLRAAWATLRCNTAYDQLRSQSNGRSLTLFAAAAGEVSRALEGYSSCLQELERVRYLPSHPRFMIYEARAYSGFLKLAGLYSELLERARDGETDYLPEAVVEESDLFGRDLGMALPPRRRRAR